MIAQTIHTRRPLVIGLPGSFDSAEYASYRSWLRYLPEVGTDIRMLDMLQLSGVQLIDQSSDGLTYYCDWHPEDYFNLMLSTIKEFHPSKIILLGFGSGACDAIRYAPLIAMLGYPLAGVVGVSPHTLTHKADTQREFEDLPKKLATEVELRAESIVHLDERDRLDPDNLMSCIRYEDLRKPHNGARNTFYVPKSVLQRYHEPLSEILARVQVKQREGSQETNQLIQSMSPYTIPTALIAAADSWYLPPAKVRALARRSRQAPTSCIELPGVCYDFRAYPSQIENVTEAVMNKVGQLLSTGTVYQPRPASSLLMRHPTVNERPMGTMVLSSARATHNHRAVIDLAKASGTNLIVLASHGLNPDSVAEDMSKAGVRGCVIEVPSKYILPQTTDFEADKHPQTVERTSNLSAKRNIGLLYGHLTGQKIFFIDDDIRGLSPKRLRRAAALLDYYSIAGFMSSEHPDNSVVCHANRLAGNAQEVFISGSALGVNAGKIKSFFPNIYNEDWLFCHDALKARDAVFLGDVKQLPYDPFIPERATSEEFGDVLAEGLQYLLTIGKTFEMADENFWRFYLWRRRKFIASIANRLVALPDVENSRAEQALKALDASRSTLTTFVPVDFVSYVKAWRNDNSRWQQEINMLPQQLSAEGAMQLLASTTGLKIRPIGA